MLRFGTHVELYRHGQSEYDISWGMHHTLLQADKDVAFRQLGDECLLVPIRRSPTDKLSVFTLNPVGVLVWKELQHPRSVDEVTAAVVAAFEVTRDVAARDVAAFVAELGARALVKEA